jgi:hypothetical protein
LRRERRIDPVNLWRLTRVLFYFAREPRVQSAPGFPCALDFREAKSSCIARALRAAGSRTLVCVIAKSEANEAIQTAYAVVFWIASLLRPGEASGATGIHFSKNFSGSPKR